MKNETEISKAVNVLKEALKTDPDYRRAWVANIAVSIADEVTNAAIESNGVGILPHEWYGVFNRGAERFLNILCLDHKSYE